MVLYIDHGVFEASHNEVLRRFHPTPNLALIEIPRPTVTGLQTGRQGRAEEGIIFI